MRRVERNSNTHQRGEVTGCRDVREVKAPMAVPGRTLAGSVQLWDAATGTPLIPSHVLPGTATSMAFLDATQIFLVVTGDGVLHRWHCVPTPESTEELSRLSDALNGVPPTR